MKWGKIYFLNDKLFKNNNLIRQIGGEAGIRTLGGDQPSTVFKTAAFDRSATSPQAAYNNSPVLKINYFISFLLIYAYCYNLGNFLRSSISYPLSDYPYQHIREACV
jgi:hypothetical protein